MCCLWLLRPCGQGQQEAQIPKEVEVGSQNTAAPFHPPHAPPSTSKSQKPLLCPVPSTLQSLHPSPSSTMANYPLNPIPFLPPGFAVEPGPADRLIRSGMVVGPIAPLSHEFLAIAETSHYVPLHRRSGIRDQITALLHESQLYTTEVSDHLFGIGIFGFVDSFLRDTSVNTPIELEEEDLLVTFVPHNEALNRRTTSFGPEVWLMFFGFPYDYQTDYYLSKALRGYCSLVSWYNPRQDRRFVLLKARVIPSEVNPQKLCGLETWGSPGLLDRSGDHLAQ